MNTKKEVPVKSNEFPELPIDLRGSSWGGRVQIYGAVNIANSGEWNPMAIVAVVNTMADGQIGDWAAYKGEKPFDMTEQEALEYIADHGEKLLDTVACAIFHNLPPFRYRG